MLASKSYLHDAPISICQKKREKDKHPPEHYAKNHTEFAPLPVA